MQLQPLSSTRRSDRVRQKAQRDGIPQPRAKQSDALVFNPKLAARRKPADHHPSPRPSVPVHVCPCSSIKSMASFRFTFISSSERKRTKPDETGRSLQHSAIRVPNSAFKRPASLIGARDSSRFKCASDHRFGLSDGKRPKPDEPTSVAPRMLSGLYRRLARRAIASSRRRATGLNRAKPACRAVARSKGGTISPNGPYSSLGL